LGIVKVKQRIAYEFFIMKAKMIKDKMLEDEYDKRKPSLI